MRSLRYHSQHLILPTPRCIIFLRNINKTLRGGRKYDENSTDPSCTGFVEMMAPVYSRASWRCIWHIIQNDLVHGLGFGFPAGLLCTGIPSLGGLAANKTIAEAHDQPAHNISLPTSEQLVSNPRTEVRKLSLVELEKFQEQMEKGNQRR